MAATLRETILMKTPQGHDVLAELDYPSFGVHRARVVHGFTGVTRPIDEAAKLDLERALRARQLYEQALSETHAIEQTIAGFGPTMQALGEQHPALAPYWREARQHREIANQMCERARYFHAHAMRAIDRLAEN